LFDFCIVYGHLLTVGDNSYGQLGQGDYKRHEGPCRVRSNLSGDKVLQAACGDGYTIVCTASEWSLFDCHFFHLSVLFFDCLSVRLSINVVKQLDSHTSLYGHPSSMDTYA
jgi:hypothetical protein